MGDVSSLKKSELEEAFERKPDLSGTSKNLSVFPSSPLLSALSSSPGRSGEKSRSRRCILYFFTDMYYYEYYLVDGK